MIPWFLAALVYSDMAYQGYKFYTKKSSLPKSSGNVKKQIRSTTYKPQIFHKHGGRIL